MKTIVFSLFVLCSSKIDCQSSATMTDIRNNKTYNIVLIGDQWWMAENLDVEVFQNGDTIIHARTDEEWINANQNKQPAWCYYKNNPENGIKYGKLYNWYAVNDSRGLAPEGWHIPRNYEWTVIDKFLGWAIGSSSKMKSQFGWNKTTESITCPNCDNWNELKRKEIDCNFCNNDRKIISLYNSGDGNNESGFSALPGGLRFEFGHFNYLGSYGCFWSNTEYYQNSESAYYRMMQSASGGSLGVGSKLKGVGLSVRCISDF